MKKREKYLKRALKEVSFQEGIKVAITGATGSLGKSLAYYFTKMKASVLLIGRNEKKLQAVKEELMKEGCEISYLTMDLENPEDVKKQVEVLKGMNIDLFYNNAGLFHQDIEIRGKYDRTFLTDYLTPIYIEIELSKVNPNIKFVNTASISYNYYKFQKDLQGLNIKSKTKRYGFIKRLLMMESIHLQKLGVHSYLAHPGVSCTNLFSKENKAYPKIFYVIVPPLMKIIFMSPDKACLPLLYMGGKEYPEGPYYTGPRGLFHSWGYPNLQKIKKELMNDEDVNYLHEETMKMIEDCYS